VYACVSLYVYVCVDRREIVLVIEEIPCSPIHPTKLENGFVLTTCGLQVDANFGAPRCTRSPKHSTCKYLVERVYSVSRSHVRVPTSASESSASLRLIIRGHRSEDLEAEEVED